MLEYASIRLILVWGIATMLPMVILITASAAKIKPQFMLSHAGMPKAEKNTRSTTAKPAPLLATER
jgi:hypothetical protein